MVKNGPVNRSREDPIMKREIKKKLKEDEFVSGFGHIVDYLKTWHKEAFTILAVVIGLVVLWSGFRILQGIQTRKSSASLGQILTLRGELDKAPQNLAKLEALAEKGKFARVAAAELASYWVGQGDLVKAEKSLEGIKATAKDFFYFQAQDLTAQIAVLKGEYDRAIKIFQVIEEAKPKEFTLDAVLFHRAEALEKKGDRAEALKVFKKIQEEYPQSYYGYDAGLRARKLEPAK
jgi:predicted negative regulator of RcsB-dependent stress response